MSDNPELDDYLGQISKLLKPLTDEVDRQARELRQLKDDMRKPKRFVRDAQGRIIGAEPAVSTLNKVGNT